MGKCLNAHFQIEIKLLSYSKYLTKLDSAKVNSTAQCKNQSTRVLSQTVEQK